MDVGPLTVQSLAGSAPRAADAKRVEVALEALYYDGGIRYLAVDGREQRPDWAPPADYVGLRNQVGLREGIAAVEFARFLHDGRRITWIGVFYRSVDLKYGDRQNHAGVGAWLLDCNVADAHNLLHGLRQLAHAVASGDVASTTAKGPRFAAEFLPTYVSPAPNLPPPLDGVPFATPPILDDVVLAAGGSTAEEQWDATAGHIIRLSYTRPDGTTSRTFIIIGGAQGRETLAPASVSQVPSSRPERDLITAIPIAFDQLVQETENLKQAEQAARERSEALTRDCNAARDELAEARQGIVALEELTAADGQARMLQQVMLTISKVAKDTEGLTERLCKIEVAIRSIVTSNGPRRARDEESVLPPLKPRGTRHRFRTIRSYARSAWLPLLLVAIFLGLLVTLVWFLTAGDGSVDTELPPLLRGDRLSG